MGNYSAVVIDFETTGLSPESGDRVIEVGAVLVENSRIVDSFQSLMNPGRKISSFIETYTGITNGMLANAPPICTVMEKLAAFLGNHHLVAHNASFDRRFLDAELRRITLQRKGEMACSMLLSRRVYPEARNHSLQSLVDFRRLDTCGVYHRALADAEMTAHLWIAMTEDLKRNYGLTSVSFDLMQRLSRVSRKEVPAFLGRVAGDRV